MHNKRDFDTVNASSPHSNYRTISIMGKMMALKFEEYFLWLIYPLRRANEIINSLSHSLHGAEFFLRS